MNEVRSPVRPREEVVGPSVDELAVRFVEDEGDALLLCEVCECAQECRRIDRAGRIVRSDQDDRSRSIRNEGPREFDRRQERRGATRERDERDAELAKDHLVVEIPRRRQDHFVSRTA